MREKTEPFLHFFFPYPVTELPTYMHQVDVTASPVWLQTSSHKRFFSFFRLQNDLCPIYISLSFHFLLWFCAKVTFAQIFQRLVV
jgi:hypothetical protein